MPKRAAILNFLTIIGLCTTLPCFGQTSKAEADLNAIIKRFEVTGLSTVVVKKGKVVYTCSFGNKDIAANIPLTNTDIFRIASISKSFSATSIMQLVEAGKLSLDDDISDLIGFKVRNPKFPEMVITLRMVLSHTSSINDSQGYYSLDVINPATNPQADKCYNNYEPGKSYRYCNLNFNMVGAIIEKYSGERFDNYVKRHILDPLGLYGGYNIDSLDANRFATLYEYSSKTKEFTPGRAYPKPVNDTTKKYIIGYSAPKFSPTGGMKISAPDLATYMLMHMNKGKYKGVRIISKKSAKLMQTKLSEPQGYGLAIMNRDDFIPGQTLTGHTGNAYGLLSAMFFHPKEKYGFVVISTGSNPYVTKDYDAVLKACINSLYTNFIK